ncbi:S8 family serine peptidase [Candidatus Parcubacteria bacterium]|nr:S8 family serine peptidase [Patescibacteria group bacterium]MCG2694436.1 S8 family serine peptidase [Candidatus Parcubacteria bacterium]
MLRKLFYIITICALLLPFFPAKAQNEAPAKFYLTGLAVSDIGVDSQWYLDKISAPDAWMETQGSSDIIVAVIDSGVELNHPDLKNNIWINLNEIPGNGLDDDNNGYIDDVKGWDFIENDNDPEPNLENPHTIIAVHHGTAVAGIIAAEGNNAFAGAGIAWKAKIMDLRAFDEIGESDTVLVQRAIEYAVKNGADIINMSFVGLGYSSALEETIKYAYQKGVLMVAAAGNESNSMHRTNLDITKSYPVCFDGEGENWVLGVAGTDMEDALADFSNYGKKCIDLAAPATDIFSSLFYDPRYIDFDKYFGGKLNGTSMSAPQVSGAAVLVKALHPNYTNKEIMEVLINSTDNIDGANPYYAGYLGSGRLNVFKAVNHEPISMESVGEQEIKYVLGAVPGDEPKIWLLDGKGDVKKEFFAFAPSFRGGVNLALGDIDNDGIIEIIAGAGVGGGPQIRIFNLSGELENQFFTYETNHRNGVNVVVGDLNGDEKLEIIASEARGGKEIKVFNQNGVEISDKISLGDTVSQIVSADMNKDGKDEIIAAVGKKIKTLNSNGELLGEFVYGYNKGMAAGDINGDGWAEIILTDGNVVKTYTYSGRLLSPGFVGADFVSSGDRDGDKEYEILTRQGSKLYLWDKNLNRTATLYPFGADSKKKFSAYIVSR